MNYRGCKGGKGYFYMLGVALVYGSSRVTCSHKPWPWWAKEAYNEGAMYSHEKVMKILGRSSEFGKLL